MAKKQPLLGFCIALGGILVAMFLWVFFFALFVIPTPLMLPAIISGDKVMVNKLISGPRSIRNLFSLHKDEQPDIVRLKGTRAIRRNDVLISNTPEKSHYTKGKEFQRDMKKSSENFKNLRTFICNIKEKVFPLRQNINPQ